MKKDLDVVLIENNEYAILKEIKHKNCTYLYLSNIESKGDTMIRKVTDNNSDLIVPLADDDEFNLACALIFKNEKRA